MLNEPRDLSLALPANYPEFPDSWVRIQLTLLIDVLKVLTYGAHILLEEVRDERLAQPQRLVGEPALHAGAAIPRLIEDDLAERRRRCGHRLWVTHVPDRLSPP